MAYNTETFIKKVKEKLGSKVSTLDFSDVVYVSSSDRVTVHCSEHGTFTPQARSLTSGRGCPKCKNRMTPDKFIDDCAKALGAKFYTIEIDKNKFVGIEEKIEVKCVYHGVFTPQARSLTSGRGCPKCKQEKTHKEYIKEALKINGNIYDLSKVKYTRRDRPITVICKEHGEFNILPKDFLNKNLKSKCPHCKQPIYTSMSINTLKLNEHKDDYCILYSLKFTHIENNEKFYKVGITTKGIIDRFKQIRKYYKIEVIDLYEGTLLDCKEKEEQLLSENEFFKYTPKEKIGGYTECLSKPTYFTLH